MWYRGATLKTVKRPERSGTTAVRSTYGNDTMNRPKAIAYCSLIILVALYIVGAVSNGSLRHEVQTLPLWVPIVLGFRQGDLAKMGGNAVFRHLVNADDVHMAIPAGLGENTLRSFLT